ncbi:MAG: helix-turn-helix domain-containing protein [Solirubrobacteraceae bacterium]|jgi:excisionase family DNA binding protein
MVAPATGPSNDPDERLTVAQVAAAVGIDGQMVRYWIKRGELPAARPGRRVYHVKRSDARGWATRQGLDADRLDTAGRDPERERLLAHVARVSEQLRDLDSRRARLHDRQAAAVHAAAHGGCSHSQIANAAGMSKTWAQGIVAEHPHDATR